jgi:hypothetical protein
MKTSKKILLFVAGFILVLLIIYVGILRNTVQTVRSKAEIKHNYRTVSAGDFEKLDFSSPMIVRILHGKDCKVEFTDDEDSLKKPGIENINGTLYLKADSTDSAGSIHVRITMPSLQEIKASGGTEIQLENFQADSVNVILENGCVFKGKNNSLKRIFFKTSGDASLELTSIL